MGGGLARGPPQLLTGLKNIILKVERKLMYYKNSMFALTH